MCANCLPMKGNVSSLRDLSKIIEGSPSSLCPNFLLSASTSKNRSQSVSSAEPQPIVPSARHMQASGFSSAQRTYTKRAAETVLNLPRISQRHAWIPSLNRPLDLFEFIYSLLSFLETFTHEPCRASPRRYWNCCSTRNRLVVFEQQEARQLAACWNGITYPDRVCHLHH